MDGAQVGSPAPGGADMTVLAPSQTVIFTDVMMRVHVFPDGATACPAIPRVGLIAEEVARVFPRAVAVDPGGRARGIHYGVLTGLVIEEIQARTVRAVGAGIVRLAGAL